MPCVETLRVDVSLVDVDLDQIDTVRTGLRGQFSDHRGADALIAAVRRDVQLVEQRDLAVVPDVRAQRHQRDADRRHTGQDGERRR